MELTSYRHCEDQVENLGGKTDSRNAVGDAKKHALNGMQTLQEDKNQSPDLLASYIHSNRGAKIDYGVISKTTPRHGTFVPQCTVVP